MMIEPLTEKTKEEALLFLLKHEDTSLFLLGNLETYGLRAGQEPYSGNFKVLRSSKGIVGVFCLTRCGNLLIQSEENEFGRILISCKEENIPIKGLLGEWDFCWELWEYFKAKEAIQEEAFISKEVLYTMELHPFATSCQQEARLLGIDDYEEWKVLDSEYRAEQKLPDEFTEEERIRLFASMVQNKSIWGLLVEDRLAVKAELNARAGDLGQVGGVFTATGYRQKSLAKSLMLQLFHDAKNLLKLRKLIIFTGEENVPARRLYDSLGACEVGHFALLFGK